MATPFRFGLQRVRDLRAHDEEQAKEQFANSLSQRLRGEALLRAAEEQLRTAHEVVRPSSVSGPLTGPSLVARQAWVDRLKRTRDEAADDLQGLNAELERRRVELTDASRRREVLDQLEAQQREAHRREAERREGAELDEIALRAHGRRRAA